LAFNHHGVEAPGAAPVVIASRESVKIGDAVGVTAAELGVDNAGWLVEHRLADYGEAPRDVLAVAAENQGTRRGAVKLRAPPIVLHLVRQLGADGRGFL